MENRMGFVKWMLRDCYRDITLWGTVIAVSGFIVMAWEGSLLLIWLLLSVGMSLILFDLTYNFIKFQYSLYRMERDKVMRELNRKES